MVTTDIFTMQERTGKIEFRASYTLPPDKALVAFVEQQKKNYNFWTYPKRLVGMRESPTASGNWYYDDIPNNQIIAAYERVPVYKEAT